jgi:hypothetical protein
MATLPQPENELVKVFDTEQESEAMVVRGLLESAGVDAMMRSLEAPQDVLPGVGGIIIEVREGQAEEARRIIEDYQTNPPREEDFTAEEQG